MTIFTRRLLAGLTATALTFTTVGTTPAFAAEDSPAPAAGNTAAATGTGVKVEGAETIADKKVTLEKGTANMDWVHSFRLYVGEHQETRTGGVELDPHNHYLLWPVQKNQEIDLDNLTELKLDGSVNWVHHGGILNVTLSNPTIDFVNKKLVVDGNSVGTLKKPGVAVNERGPLLDLTDLKAEIVDGYLRVTSFKPVNTAFADKLVGFYEGESREPIVLTAKIADSETDNPEPILWKLFPERYGSLRPNSYYEEDPSLLEKPISIDPRLEECVRWELDLEDSKEPLTNKDMHKLTRLFCIGEGKNGNGKVKDISALAFAPRLARLNISQQEISDLSPLQQLENLIELDVSSNPLKTLSGLGYQPKLQTLRANNAQLETIEHLFSLKALTSLEVNDNDLDSLTGLPDPNESPNDDYDLNEVQAANNRIREADILSKYTYLKKIDLRNNQLDSVEQLAIRGLETLDVRDNYISDLSPLETIAAKPNGLAIVRLEKIHAENNLVEDVSGLSEDLKKYLSGVKDGKLPVRENTERPAATVRPDISPISGAVSIMEGEELKLSVTVTGTPEPAVTWEKEVDGNWVAVEGASGTTFTKTVEKADNGAKFRAVATNERGSKATAAVTVAVESKPEVPAPSEPSETPKPGQTGGLGTGAIVGIVAGVLGLLGLAGHVFLNFNSIQAQIMHFLAQFR
ncbi:hypothetical protein CPHO_00825 [Corynebacterium phocae]|uniref:Ig-like domain-containing protein n=1 Tax=Corynebacterium phocae TaxID=161895 RepID=A0A1L7D0V0_9CORY|nr:HtaA domain-containing protein [Corynebacterium phocae]APT91708.1 hypothetical protein CPHO_00825 [Corynebacterium phocae]KAA8728614.1 hypothetical protein F4V58_00375 [Corynebacterium phocae]